MKNLETIRNSESRREFIQKTAALVGGGMAVGAVSMNSAVAAAIPQGVTGAASQMSKSQKLRALLRKPGFIHAPEAYNPLSAALAENRGFDVIYVGGNMMSGTYLVAPDWGVITNVDMVAIAGPIARAVSIPTIVDGDQGGETTLNVFHTVQQYQRAGFAAIHLEDLLNPKLHPAERAKFMPGDPIGLASVDRMILRLQAAQAARTDPDFVIIARTLEEDPDKIIARGKAYAKAGADMFMNNFSGLKADQVDRIGREVGIPMVGIGVKLANRGTQLKLNVYANMTSAPASALNDTLLQELKDKGEYANRPGLSEDIAAKLKEEDVLAKFGVSWVTTP